jgi:cytochrome c
MNCSILGCCKTIEGQVLRNHFALLAAAVLGMSIAGCGEKADGPDSQSKTAPLPTAATLGEQIVLSTEDYLAADPYVSANQSRGEKQARVCRACHSLDKGGPNMIGPALFGFFGTEVGTRSGFEYSAVMRSVGFVWTPEALNAWLAQPGRFLPGNRMTFAGVLKQDDRDDLIAYLLTVTSAVAIEKQE